MMNNRLQDLTANRVPRADRGPTDRTTGARLSVLLRAMGITSRELARSIGVSESLVSHTLSGRRGLGHLLSSVEEALGRSLSDARVTQILQLERSIRDDSTSQ